MEAFYTLQGEGYHSGAAAYFIRLAGCDVGCVWCDVKESWEVEEHQWQPVDQIVADALKHPARIAVITGGEPCMYNLTKLTSELKKAGYKVHIETSGAYSFIGTADWICVSPKKFMKPLPELLALADELKVVVFNESDFQWAEEHAVHTKPGCYLFLQPEFSKSEKITPIITNYVMNNPSWKISLQIHKFIGIP